MPQVPLLLLRAVPFHGVGLGGAIPLPVAGVVGAPLASAVAADLAILRIEDELPFTVLATALPLAWFVRTGSLLRVKSGWFELPLAETATPLFHPFRVEVRLRNRPGFAAVLPSQRKLPTGKEQTLSRFGRRGAQLNGLAG
jgi:hypothetical protein